MYGLPFVILVPYTLDWCRGSLPIRASSRGARIVTFGNGMVLREPIIAVDDHARRLVWSAEGGPFTHYNASLQVFAERGGATRVVWIADFLPDEVAGNQRAAMEAALQIMKTNLDRFAEK